MADEETKPDENQASVSVVNTLSIRQIMHTFLDYTTAHGCGRWAASRGVFWTWFWAILILGAHAAFYYHAYLLISNYSQKATRTKMSQHNKKKLDFPVVTICNRNMLRKSMMGPDMKKNIGEILNITTEQKPQDTHLNTSRSYLQAEDKHPEQAKDDSFKAICSKYPKKDLIEMGHQLNDMLLDCSFGGQSCRNIKDARTWRHLWIEDVGNCFMFNRGLGERGEKTRPHKQLFQGRDNGLKLILNIEQQEYIEGITEVAGLRVFIGDHGEMPFPIFDGLSVGPGLSTDIEIKMRHTKRMDPFKNNTCKESKEPNSSNIYNIYNISYSKKACELSCLSHNTQRRCSCSPLQFVANNNNTSLCNSSDQRVSECLEEVYDEFLAGKCDQSCPPLCFQVSFDNVVSNSKWPANHFKNYLTKKIEKETSLPLTDENIKDNLLQIRVYYGNMDYIRVEESLKYDFEDLISDIGGQMGMWIGVSALTIAEVIELVWKLLSSVVKKRSAKNTRSFQSKELSTFDKT